MHWPIGSESGRPLPPNRVWFIWVIFFSSKNNMYDIIITIFLVASGLLSRVYQTVVMKYMKSTSWTDWYTPFRKHGVEHRDERARVKSGFPNSLTGVTKSCVEVRLFEIFLEHCCGVRFHISTPTISFVKKKKKQKAVHAICSTHQKRLSCHVAKLGYCCARPSHC